jgi:biopolymer transport protein ExbD
MRLRRTSVPVRLEMTPLIDVVFLLLTFFIFALVLMVRADVLDIQLPEIGGGASAERTGAIVVSLTRTGEVLVEGESVQPDRVGEKLAEARAGREESTTVLLTADARVPAGKLIELADRLVAAGVREFSIVGSPESPTNPERTPGEE